jgi:hypothetical protein
MEVLQTFKKRCYFGCLLSMPFQLPQENILGGFLFTFGVNAG